MKRIKAIIISLIIFLVVIYLTGLFIKAPKLDNAREGKVELIGHAGSAFTYLVNPWNPLPSNSLASIYKAFQNGAEGVEVDVQVSADSILILYHDLVLQSNTKLSDCVFNNNSKNLLDTEYSLGFPYDWFQQERIISLNQLENYLVSKKNYKLYMDIKINYECESKSESDPGKVMIESLNNYFNRTNLNRTDITIISDSEILLNQLKHLNSDLNYALDCNESFDENIKLANQYGFKSLCINYKQVSKEITKKIHNNGLEVILFGGKSKIGLRKMLELNPDVVQVNNVKAMYEILN